MKKDSSSQNNSHTKLQLFCIATILMTFVSIAATVVLALKYQSVSNENSQLKTGYALQKWQPKQEVITPVFGITVESISVDDKGVPPQLQLPEGYVFIVVDLTVRNLAADEKLFLPQDHLYIRDEAGLRYDLTAAPKVEKSVAGAVVAGDKIRGQVGYMVPKDQKNLTLYFEPYGDGAGKTAAFDLSSLL